MTLEKMKFSFHINLAKAFTSSTHLHCWISKAFTSSTHLHCWIL